MVERDINYRLIKEIEKYPILYNFNLPQYSNKVLAKKAWNEIAKKTNVSVADCKEKWRNVRSSFIRSKKPPPKKPYYLAEHLNFVLPYVKPFQNMADPLNFPSYVEEQQELEGDINETENLQGDENTDEENSDLDDHVGATDKNVANDSTPSSFAESSFPGRMRCGKKRYISEVDNAPIDPIKKTDSHKDTNTPSTHPMQYFFLSLLGEFDTMTESQMRHFKIRVLQLIDEIKTEDILENKFSRT